MSGLGVVTSVCYLLTVVSVGRLQDVDAGVQNIFEALSTTLNCGKFKALIIEAGLQTQEFYMRSQYLTVFAPNDTAFDQMSPYRRDRIYNMSPQEKENYVKSYTLPKMIRTSSMNDSLIEESLAGPASYKIFFSRRTSQPTTPVHGTAGRTEVYANGALIYKPDIRAQNGIIHLIDRVLDPSIPSKIYGYLQQPDPTRPTVSLKFFKDITNCVSGEYYAQAITPLQTSNRFTMFVPTDEAISKIPQGKLEELRSNQPKLSRVIRQHAIRDKAVYTSLVYHNEGYECNFGRAIFKKNIRDKVMVSAGGVTAEITVGNLTLSNGVIHFVDSLLGFVYNTAREQVKLDPTLRQFEQLIDSGRQDLQDFLVSPNGVTVFAPMDEAFDAVRPVPGADFSNQTLNNFVFELHLLEQGTSFEITNVNGDYMSRIETRTQYKGWNLKIYRQGQDTWVEGGYVKARVVRPDVAVTNGFVHYIDGILGIPPRDVPGIIYCEDMLIKSSYLLSIVGLNDFMKDTRITSPLPPCEHEAARGNYNSTDLLLYNNNNNTGDVMYRGGCGESNVLCEFTIFIPDGTTIDNFQKTENGRQLFMDNNTLRYVLERHIVINTRIYLDQLSTGEHNYTTANGNEISVKKVSDYYAEVIFLNKRARVIHSDLGATNGVVHTVDNFLFVEEDLHRNTSSSSNLTSTTTTQSSNDIAIAPTADDIATVSTTDDIATESTTDGSYPSGSVFLCGDVTVTAVALVTMYTSLKYFY